MTSRTPTRRLAALVDRGPLLCLLGCILFQGFPWAGLGLPPTPLSDLLGLVAFAWGALRALRRGRVGVFGLWPFVLGAVGVSLALVAAMGSPQPTLAGQGLIRIIQVFLVMPGAFLLTVRTRADLKALLGSFLALFLLQAVINVWQNLTGHGALIAGAPIRGVGTFGPAQIQVAGAMVAAGIAIATAFTISYVGKARVYGLVMVVVLWAGLIAGLARSSWIAAAGVTTLLLTRFGLRRALGVFGAAAVAGYGLILAAQASHSALGDRLLSVVGSDSAPDQSEIDRLSLWTAARAILDRYPLFGLGPRQFQAHRDAYAPFSLLGSSDIGSSGSFARQALLSPHNLYYLLSTEFGIPAATCFVTIVAAALIIGVVRLRRTPRENRLAWFAGLAAAGVAFNFFIDGMFGDLGGSGTLLISWAVAYSVWWAAHDRSTLAGTDAWAAPGIVPQPGRLWWLWGTEQAPSPAGEYVVPAPENDGTRAAGRPGASSEAVR